MHVKGIEMHASLKIMSLLAWGDLPRGACSSSFRTACLVCLLCAWELGLQVGDWLRLAMRIDLHSPKMHHFATKLLVIYPQAPGPQSSPRQVRAPTQALAGSAPNSPAARLPAGLAQPSNRSSPRLQPAAALKGAQPGTSAAEHGASPSQRMISSPRRSSRLASPDAPDPASPETTSGMDFSFPKRSLPAITPRNGQAVAGPSDAQGSADDPGSPSGSDASFSSEEEFEAFDAFDAFENAQTEEERWQRDEAVLQEAALITHRRAELRSDKKVPAFPEPKRDTVHWDHVLAEMKWLAKVGRLASSHSILA